MFLPPLWGFGFMAGVTISQKGKTTMQYFAKRFHSNHDTIVPAAVAFGTSGLCPLRGILCSTYKVSKIGKNGFKVKSETTFRRQDKAWCRKVEVAPLISICAFFLSMHRIFF